MARAINLGGVPGPAPDLRERRRAPDDYDLDRQFRARPHPSLTAPPENIPVRRFGTRELLGMMRGPFPPAVFERRYFEAMMLATMPVLWTVDFDGLPMQARAARIVFELHRDGGGDYEFRVARSISIDDLRLVSGFVG